MSDILLVQQSRTSKCFLCRQGNLKCVTYKISEHACPVSKKPVSQVLKFIAQFINSAIDSLFQIPNDAIICEECFHSIADYDRKFVSLLKKQRVLERLVEKAILDVDVDVEDECYYDMETLSDMNDEQYTEDVAVAEADMQKPLQVSAFAKTANFDRRAAQERKPSHQTKTCWNSDQEAELCCEICGCPFTSKQHLDAHIDHEHKKHKCQFCDYCHRNKDYVLLHLNSHEGRSETECRFCGKRFSTKVSTIRHMESHYSSKNYQCDKCGLTFAQTTSLYNHKMLHENEDNPLNCNICSAKFKTRRTYRHHMNRHRPDRPRFFCNLCSRSFTEKYTLKVHHWRVHNAIYSKELDDLPSTNESTNVQEIIIAEDYIVEGEDHCLQAAGQDVETAIAVGSITDAADLPIIYAMEEAALPEKDASGSSATVTARGKRPRISTASQQERLLLCVICNNIFPNRDTLDRHMEDYHDVILKPVSMYRENN